MSRKILNDEHVIMINGDIVKSNQAKIDFYNAGYMYGLGFFDTIRSYNGIFYYIDLHYNRIVNSCKMLKITIPFTKEEWLYNLQKINETRSELLKSNVNQDAIFRTTITPANMVSLDSYCGNSYWTIHYREIPLDIEDKQKTGINACFLKTRRLSGLTNNRVKSTYYADIVFARQELQEQSLLCNEKIDEGLMFDSIGWLVEGTVNNVFLIYKENNQRVLRTPADIYQPVPGIMRQVISRIAVQIGIRVEFAAISRTKVLLAEGLFFCNAVQGIIPVNKLYVYGDDHVPYFYEDKSLAIELWQRVIEDMKQN